MNFKRLARVLIVFLAGTILMVNTACSQTPSANTYSSRGSDDTAGVSSDAQSANSSSTKPYSAQPTPHASDKSGTYPLEKIQSKHMKESYSTTEAKPGSMNVFKDSEPGVDRAGSKADYLVNQAKENLQKRAANPKEAVDNLRETASAQKVGEKLGQFPESAKNTAQGAAEGAKRGFKNLQENAKSAADDVSDNVSQKLR